MNGHTRRKTRGRRPRPAMAALLLPLCLLLTPAHALADADLDIDLVWYGPTMAVVGSDQVTYTVDITNNGPDPSGNFSVVSTLGSDPVSGGPGIFTGYSSTGMCTGTSIIGQVFTHSPCSLASGASGWVEVVTRTPEKGAVTLTYDVVLTPDPAVADLNTTNNSWPQIQSMTVGPSIHLWPNTVRFDMGYVAVGTVGEYEISIINLGNDDLEITDVYLFQAPIPEVSLNLDGGTSPCMSSSLTLAAADSCTVSVTFTPLSETGFFNRFQVESNDVGDPTVMRDISGTSVPPPSGGGGGGSGGCNTAGPVRSAPLLTDLLWLMMVSGVFLAVRRRVGK